MIIQHWLVVHFLTRSSFMKYICTAGIRFHQYLWFACLYMVQKYTYNHRLNCTLIYCTFTICILFEVLSFVLYVWILSVNVYAYVSNSFAIFNICKWIFYMLYLTSLTAVFDTSPCINSVIMVIKDILHYYTCVYCVLRFKFWLILASFKSHRKHTTMRI